MKEEKPAQVWVPVENDDMHCFACGKENRYGLKMGFESNGEKLRSGIIVPEHLRGWENLVRGGIISTILDEAMSWQPYTCTSISYLPSPCRTIQQLIYVHQEQENLFFLQPNNFQT